MALIGGISREMVKEDGLTLACPYCDYEAPTDKRLKEHIINHMQGSQFTCKICHSIQKSQQSLERHYKYIHSNERRFVCQYCGFASVEKHKLRSHMRIHTNDRPYKCSICERKFAQNIALKRHQLVHKDEKNCICVLCYETFKHDTTLRTHMSRIHYVENVHRSSIRNCSDVGLPKTVEWYITKLGAVKEDVLKKHRDLRFYEIKPAFTDSYSKHFQKLSPVIYEAENVLVDDDYEYPDILQSRLFLSQLNEVKNVVPMRMDLERTWTSTTSLNEEEDAVQTLMIDEKVQTDEKGFAVNVPKFDTCNTEVDQNDNCLLLPKGKNEKSAKLLKMKTGEYGPAPHVVKVLEDGSIVDVTGNYLQHLPDQPCI